MARYRTNGRCPSLPRRTRDYLVNGAPEGQRNSELFDAACQMRDAGQEASRSESQLLARAIEDGLSESEARQTIQSAYGQAPREPIGAAGFNGGSGFNGGAGSNGTGPPALPAPLEDGFIRLLDTCFEDDEFVSIAPGCWNDDGEIAPRSGITATARQWKEDVAAKGGIDKIFTTKLGLWMRLNPMCDGGTCNEDVTDFRHVLVEFDLDQNGKTIPKEKQLQVIKDSGLPVAALIDSGNKSLHAWIRVDARDAKQYRQRVDVIWEVFDGCNLDRQNRNPSRLSRCPDGWRTEDGELRQQALLATNLGAASWAAWEQAANAADLPKILAGADFMANPVPEPIQLVEGVLHKGAKMVLGGPSKARKSWSLIDLMLSVASGLPWWGLPTTQGRALYLNFELPAFALQYRIGRIAQAKGIAKYAGFDVWNLRGHATDFSELIPRILTRIQDNGYALIIIDPIYKGLGGRNENDAGDIASLLNEVEQLAEKSGAAVVFGAHFSKGNQSGKDAIDRIGGSGVFARDPDVILTMTPHEEDQAHIIDLTLRALPPVKPFVVRWNDAIFDPAPRADATKPLKPGESPKPAVRGTRKLSKPGKGTKRGEGVVARLGEFFAHMPPTKHQAPENGPSDVLERIRNVVAEQANKDIDLKEATRMFDLLRNPRYRVIVFRQGLWQGRSYTPLLDENEQTEN